MTENVIALEHILDISVSSKKECAYILVKRSFCCATVSDALFCEGSFQCCDLFLRIQPKLDEQCFLLLYDRLL